MRSGPAILALVACLGSVSCSHQAVSTAVPAPRPKPPATATPAAPPLSLPGAAPLPVLVHLPGMKTGSVDRVLELLDMLWRHARSGVRPEAEKIGFELPEQQINEYLAYSLRAAPRPGVSGATVELLPGNEIHAVIEIDFGTVANWKSGLAGSLPQPFLSGRQPVRVDLQFEAENGMLTFAVKQAVGPAGTTIVNSVVVGLIQALGLHQPEQYNASGPIPLPFGLRRMWTRKQVLGGET